MALAWHGLASVNQTRPHCVNQMGKTHSKPLAARHGRGTAWARQAMCESALIVASPSSDMQFEVFYNSPKPHQTNSCRVPGNTKQPLPSLFHQISLYVFAYLSHSIVDTELLIRQCHGLGGQSPVSRRSVAGFWPRSIAFDLRTGFVGFAVEEVALGQLFLRVLRFYPDSIVPPLLFTHISFICHRRSIIVATESVVLSPKSLIILTVPKLTGFHSVYYKIL
jgi:hypothetical protein